MCEVLNVSTSGYYKWLSKPEKTEPTEEDWLSEKILEYYTKFKGIYGVRRITQEIEVVDKRHYDVKTVRRLMRRIKIIRHLNLQISKNPFLDKEYFT